jgi:hypothetical protein
MKKLLLILPILVLFGCECQHGGHVETSTASSVVSYDSGPFGMSEEIQEFDYKGHTYIFSSVRDGIAPAHAGHCNCKCK